MRTDSSIFLLNVPNLKPLDRNEDKRMELTGLHHVSAITGNAVKNLDFYTRTLGLRLVKKTVNQDDVSSYHFFYGDAVGSPGTEVTFFDWAGARANRPGAGAISTIALSVDGSEAVQWWADRLARADIPAGSIYDDNGNPSFDFKDPEGQSLRIVGEPASGIPWKESPVPEPYGIIGMHHVTLTVLQLSSISRVLVDVLGFRLSDELLQNGKPVHVFETGQGGAGKHVRVVETDELGRVVLGAGGVHHVAFRTPNVREQTEWLSIIQSAGLHVSSIIDRYYFQSIYFREQGGILFEIATDGPGFASDEDPDHLGERLALPPFLEPRRKEIEAGLVPV
jgi:glyoxalase family protein